MCVNQFSDETFGHLKEVDMFLWDFRGIFNKVSCGIGCFGWKTTPNIRGFSSCLFCSLFVAYNTNCHTGAVRGGGGGGFLWNIFTHNS